MTFETFMLLPAEEQWAVLYQQVEAQQAGTIIGFAQYPGCCPLACLFLAMDPEHVGPGGRYSVYQHGIFYTHYRKVPPSSLLCQVIKAVDALGDAYCRDPRPVTREEFLDILAQVQPAERRS